MDGPTPEPDQRPAFWVEKTFMPEKAEEIVKFINANMDIGAFVRSDYKDHGQILDEIISKLSTEYGKMLEDRLVNYADSLDRKKSRLIKFTKVKTDLSYRNLALESIVSATLSVYLTLAVALKKINEMSLEEAAHSSVVGFGPFSQYATTTYLVYKYLKENKKEGGPIKDATKHEIAVEIIEKSEKKLKKFNEELDTVYALHLLWHGPSTAQF